MDRRNFIAAAGAVAALGAAGAAQGQPAAGGNEFLEWRKYITVPNKKILENYLSKALIPAWGRAGQGPVGVFTVKYGQNSPGAIWVLLTHKSLDSFVATPAKLLADEEYLKAGEEFLNAPPSDPAFFRVETSLMRAFDRAPKVVVPPQTAAKKSRVFELRIYESHSPVAAKKKIKMFNEGGEAEIFKNAGTNPVFFAEMVAGPIMPHLEYMLCFDDMKAHDAGWSAFGGSDGWKALRSQKEFTPDPVSEISDMILQPTAYSQI